MQEGREKKETNRRNNALILIIFIDTMKALSYGKIDLCLGEL